MLPRCVVFLCLLFVSSQASEDIDECFQLFPGYYLEKSGSVFVTDLSSPLECQERCRTTILKGDKLCKSITWKRDTSDCILSRFERHDRIHFFRKNEQLDYYENICVTRPSRSFAGRLRPYHPPYLPPLYTEGRILRSTTFAPIIDVKPITDPPEAPVVRRIPGVFECFERQEGVVLKDFEERTVASLSVKECLQLCISQTAFFCASVNYELTRKLCVLNSGSTRLNEATLSVAQVDYYEYTCTPAAPTISPPTSTTTTSSSTSTTTTPSTTTTTTTSTTTTVPTTTVDRISQMAECFTQMEGRIQVNVDARIVQTETLASCLSQCISALHPCSALNWFPVTRLCVLILPGYTKNLSATKHGVFLENTCKAEEAKRSLNDDYYQS